MSLANYIPEFRRVTDRYFWLTAFVIARNSIMREYQSSFLGMMWTVVLPLIQVIIFALIMPLIMKRPVENYPFYLVVSFPLWAFISGALVQGCNSILSQSETIKRCMVSSVVFPIADVMKQFYTYAVSFVTMYIFCLFFYVSFDPYVVLVLPLLLLPIFISILSISIALAYLAPYIRDVGYVMHMLVNIMFWFTPVVYPLELVPAEHHWFFWLNPFFNLMHPVQQLIYGGTMPSVADIEALLLVTTACLGISFAIYRLCRRNYVYYL